MICRIRQADIQIMMKPFIFTQLAVPFQGCGDASGQPTSSEYSSGDDEEVAQPSAGRRGPSRPAAPIPPVWRKRAPADVTSYLLFGVTALRWT